MINFLTRWGIVTVLFLTVSCTKESAPADNDQKSTWVYDLAGDTGAAMGDNSEGKEKRGFYTFLFRFRDQRQIWLRTAADSAQWLPTADWDLAFTGPYNSEIFANDASKEYNPAKEYDGVGTAKVVMLDKAYHLVTEAPDDAVFETSEVNKIGWAGSTTSAGWFFYSLSSHIMQPIKSRTYVIKLNSGKFAKLELLNAYQGNPPVVTDLNWPAPYFTFRYYVQEDGSRNLNTN
jgi:hypothetical protein